MISAAKNRDDVLTTETAKYTVNHRKPPNSKNKETLILLDNTVKSAFPYYIYGGDDRIRTCGGLLILNNLANCRFQPLSHVSAKNAFFILAES